MTTVPSPGSTHASAGSAGSTGPERDAPRQLCPRWATNRDDIPRTAEFCAYCWHLHSVHRPAEPGYVACQVCAERGPRR